MRNPEAAAANVPRASQPASSSTDPQSPPVIDDFMRGSPVAMAAPAVPSRHQPVIHDPELLGEIALLYGYFCKEGGGDGRLPNKPTDATPENNWFRAKLPAYINKNLPKGEQHRPATLQEISVAEGTERKNMVDDLGMKAHNKFMAILESVPYKT